MGDNDKLQALLNVYNSPLSQEIHEGDLVWSRFSGFIVTHVIFFAIIGQILLSHHFVYKIPALAIISLLGIILGFLWLVSTVRGYESIKFWNYSAIELARIIHKKSKGEIPTLFYKGHTYFKEDGEAKFKIDNGKPKAIQRSCFTRLVKIHTAWTAYLSIIFLILSYMVLLISIHSGSFN